MKFLLWCILLVLCWPLALIALVLYPLVWLLLLPFRLVGIAVEGALALVWALVTLPARICGSRLTRLAGGTPPAPVWRAGRPANPGCGIRSARSPRPRLFHCSHDTTVNHELHRAGVVEQNRPAHRQLDGHANGEHVVGGEPHSAARYVQGSPRSGFGDALAVEHLVAQFLSDLKAPFCAPLPLFVDGRLFLASLGHHAPPPIRKTTMEQRRAQDVFG